jgi:hypothetical protein
LAVPVEVSTQADREGKQIPLLCVVAGKRYRIFGVGRRWQEDDGEHLMVMFPRDRAVELLHGADGSWWLLKDHSNLANRLA